MSKSVGSGNETKSRQSLGIKPVRFMATANLKVKRNNANVGVLLVEESDGYGIL